MNRYEAFPEMSGAATRRRDHRLMRRRILVIGVGAVVATWAVVATVLFGTSLVRKQANTTWGVITAVNSPAPSTSAMAASLAAKKLAASQPAQAPAVDTAPVPTPAAAPTSESISAPAPAPASTAAAEPAATSPLAPVSMDEASKMMGMAESADKTVAKDPPPAPTKLPTLTVAPTIDATAGQPSAFALSINDDGVLPDNSRVWIHGLPQEAILSAGHRDATGDWVLAPDDLNGLTVTASNTTVASMSDLLVQLKTADGKAGSEGHAVLSVASAAKPGDQSAAFSVTEKASPDDIKSWMSHGRDLERVGYLAGARLFYQRAAEAGSAEGARAMAETYDPAVFVKLGVHGLEPDPAQAQKWYARAKVLEAAQPQAAGKAP